MKTITSWLAAFALLSAAASAPATTTSFDFEGVATASYAQSFSTSSAGLTLTVTPVGFANGWLIVQNSNVALLGSKSIIGSQVNTVQSESFAPLRFSFDQPIAAITFAFGDAGGDVDSPVTIQAFNTTNTLLGTISDTYPENFAGGKTNGFAGLAGASYFILTSGVSFNLNSIYWEVPSVTTVPEPSSVALAVSSLVGLACYAWRTRRRPPLGW